MRRGGTGAGPFTPTRDRALLLAWIVAACVVGVGARAALTTPWGLDSINDWTLGTGPVR